LISSSLISEAVEDRLEETVPIDLGLKEKAPFGMNVDKKIKPHATEKWTLKILIIWHETKIEYI
jgi:hypothetical protein